MQGILLFLEIIVVMFLWSKQLMPVLLWVLSYKDIPKEMYYCETIKVYGFMIYSFLLCFMIFIDDYLGSLLGGIYIAFYCVLSILSAFLLKRKSFIERYKILNKYNIRYLFSPNNEPYPQRVGKCQIINESKRRGKVFVTVKVLDTEEEKKGVLWLGKKRERRI